MLRQTNEHFKVEALFFKCQKAMATTSCSVTVAEAYLDRQAKRLLTTRALAYNLGAMAPLSDEEETNVALKMSQREVDGVTVVALDGRIVLGEESNALREKVKELLAEGKKKIVLNVNNIAFIDSAGLGTLVASHHTAKKEAASLRLCHLDNKFQQVLQITKLLTLLYISNTEAEAVASFSK
jgi:anti-anti-sigma factor